MSGEDQWELTRSPLWKRVLCAITGHRPKYKCAVDYPTHFPYPCWCGDMMTEHIPCTCQYPKWPLWPEQKEAH